ncbi:helix-turn-helix domain-containing protein [Enterobacter roggenkampii]|uniref:helix-turn-helix domain-containing protein n=1 Tax=Enterobacter roggenkampii TaxID=1812935 RepID=UPI0007B3DB38|nr:AraC family transcriptional regulator [Enterobacter roggenkampii]KZR39086.1 AraC family transcriptional regulator [Enterobacter roggenkampii]MBW4224044.1 AraC family transcriptional regulator [Enterobacter roggenkampii]MCK7443611.1 AraC family transcriptional regulator [Enterobacter roggenkampii]MCM7079843.1 AraC family transcriptional regulator [Enterobacter roggenkampii]HCM9480344.1 AraC family transcriptional regulator [Enterobacter roggenkampii]
MTDTRHIRQTFHRASGLELRSTWQSTQAYKRHSHPQLSIGAIMEGQTCCICHDKEYILNPGDLIVIPASAPHSCNPVAGQPRSYHMLYIDTDIPLALQVIRDPALFKRYLDIVEAMSPVSVDTLLSALPRRVENADALRSTSQHVRQAFLADLAAPPSLDELAQRFSLRKETLIRTFRQDTGLTPGSFLNISRVEFAKARLRAGDDIADVGYQSGFADQSHFHKTFVSYTAATPRQYATGRSISDNK